MSLGLLYVMGRSTNKIKKGFNTVENTYNGTQQKSKMLASSDKDLASMEGLGPKGLSDIGNFIRNVNRKTRR